MVEDGVDGGVVVPGVWFNLAHPWPLRLVMEMLAWQPETLGPARENHIMRTQLRGPQRPLRQGPDRLFHLRCRRRPARTCCGWPLRPPAVSADGKPLPLRQDAAENGYTVKPLPNGDCLLTIRHDDCRDIVVEGDDPQRDAPHDRLQYKALGRQRISPPPRPGSSTSLAPARRESNFTGNQVRLIGRADPSGGKADVYLDGVKQLCGIDFWCPQTRDQQVLCYKNGLTQGKHTLEIVALGTKNPVSTGTRVYLDAAQFSAAKGESGFGQGGGPTDTQRVIFGYVGRKDLRRFHRLRLAAGNRVHHAPGNDGRPGARVVLDGAATDKTWPARPTRSFIATASTAATSRPTLPCRRGRAITCG